MKDAVLYIHGRGGSAAESNHYKTLFPNCEVIGLDYQSFSPWETAAEIRAMAEKLREAFESITLIANSIGAFFSMSAGIDTMLEKAYFISPIVDMERLIADMAARAGISEDELKEKGGVRTQFGEDLSWDYLCWVREHPVIWNVPTAILCGSRDQLVSTDTVSAFAECRNASLTVMEGGEHWFHTDEQMRFLDRWISRMEAGND